MRLQINLSPDWVLDTGMREYRPSEPVDYCIVGTGAGGGVLAQHLARYGFSVVCLEAGDWMDSETDMVSDEAGARPLYWNDLRIVGGTEPLQLGANNSGRTVGGSTVHYSAFCPRLHPSDFRMRTLDGVADDWPMTYEDLEPYYEQMEREYPVAGPARFPWGKPHGYPYAPLQSGTKHHVLVRGCLAFDIPLDHDGRVTGVRYYRTDGDGRYREEEQKARNVVVAGYAIETPRLLLNSKSGRFPNGLANSSGLVGKRLMAQAGNIVWGRFPEMIHQYKAPLAGAETEAFYETDPRNDFTPGYSLQTVSPLPIAMAHAINEENPTFGWELRHLMEEYNHYAAIGVLGEILPDDRNYVGIAGAKDRFGIPVAYVYFNLFENDRKLIHAAVCKACAVLEAAGAVETHQIPRYAHLVGTCRMGDNPADSVVDQYGRSWDVPNLFVCDGCVMVTQASANPALTISAIAARTADYIRDAVGRHEL